MSALKATAMYVREETLSQIQRVAKRTGLSISALIRLLLISSLRAGPVRTGKKENLRMLTIKLPVWLNLELWEQSKTRRVSRGAIVRGILESVDWDRLEQDIMSGEFYRRWAKKEGQDGGDATHR